MIKISKLQTMINVLKLPVNRNGFLRENSFTNINTKQEVEMGLKKISNEY